MRVSSGAGPHPFAIDQARQFQTGPFLGGYIYVLTAAVAAGGTVSVNNLLRTPPRVVDVLTTQSATYPSRVARGTPWNATVATVLFESAQPIGTVLFFY